LPDAKCGEAVAAFVQLEPNADITPEDVQDFARAKIAPYKVPQYVWMVNEYPLTASGKIQKFILREMAQERVAALATEGAE
ncbi:MAG: hypothetical protein LUC93_07140, partial [Planctomycetaceae bacterium]|nr:hypothetical protein [Planctomycetaceae bacterium]